MEEKIFKINDNPFQQISAFKASEGKREHVSTDLHPEDFKLIENYFNQRHDEVSKSKFVRELLMDFFNNNAFERKSFKNLHAIMLLPKTLNIDELNKKSKLIGFVDVEDNFSNPALFLGHAKYSLYYKFIYSPQCFNEENYKYLGLKSLDNSVLFNVSKDIQDDFELLKKRLSELYGKDIDVEDSCFVMFKLNNYLDIENKGTFYSQTSSLFHEGALVLVKSFDELVCGRYLWSFIDGELSFELHFYNHEYYMTIITREMTKNGFEQKYMIITEIMSREASLRRKIDSYSAQIKRLENMRANAENKLKEEIERDI